MKNKLFRLSRLIVMAAVVLFFMPMANYAQDHGHDRDHHRDSHMKHVANHHVRHDRDMVVEHNDEYRDVMVHNRHFFYRGGAFYERGPNGYIIATAPIGARIDVLPGGYTVIRRHGLRYYLFGGIYYRFNPAAHMYIVVNAPL
jgi:hypothetical protein